MVYHARTKGVSPSAGAWRGGVEREWRARKERGAALPCRAPQRQRHLEAAARCDEEPSEETNDERKRQMNEGAGATEDVLSIFA